MRYVMRVEWSSEHEMTESELAEFGIETVHCIESWLAAKRYKGKVVGTLDIGVAPDGV